MSCLRSGLFEYGATVRTDDIFNYLVFVPSVTDLIFGVVFCDCKRYLPIYVMFCKSQVLGLHDLGYISLLVAFLM